MLQLPGHSRYAYSPIVKRKDYAWPGGKRHNAAHERQRGQRPSKPAFERLVGEMPRN